MSDDEEDIVVNRKKQLSKKGHNRHTLADDSSDDDDLFGSENEADETDLGTMMYSPENLKRAMVSVQNCDN